MFNDVISALINTGLGLYEQVSGIMSSDTFGTFE